MNINAPSYMTPFEFGTPRIINVPNPAIGAEWTQTVPLGAAWLLIGIRSRLTNAALGGSRVYQVQVNDGTTTMIVSKPEVVTIGGEDRNFTFLQASGGALALAEISSTLMQRLWLRTGWILSSITANLAVGDQHQTIRLMVWEWLTQLA